jgi:GNAT superfamily N-acetyltransferase
LTACEILTDELPEDLARKLPRKTPGIRLGRLAVDRSVQKQGLGEHLLMDAIERARLVLEHIGVHALFVDAKDERAAAFYAKYGFRPLPNDPLRLVLPLIGLP